MAGVKEKPQRKHSPEERLQIGKEICEQYAKGEHTIASICNNKGISESCFRKWMLKSDELTKRYKKAKDDITKKECKELKELAVKAVKYQLEMPEYEEVREETLNTPQGATTKQSIHKKKLIPNAALLMGILNNLHEKFNQPTELRVLQRNENVNIDISDADSSEEVAKKYLDFMKAVESADK